ncbi:TPA: hypothetical protein H1009_00835 [archaeon]|nr:hypothetical protein [Candidatus Naiadarchaeales archaeon SRR2090153.bin461]
MVGTIIGERITRILAESKQWEPRMQIQNTPELVGLEKAEVGIGGDKKQVLQVKFRFLTKYGEDAGRIEVDGLLYYADAPKALEQLEKEWKASKEIKDSDVRIALINRILEISFLQVIALADQIKMPPPLQMPRLAPAEKKAEKARAS